MKRLRNKSRHLTEEKKQELQENLDKYERSLIKSKKRKLFPGFKY
jgi:hypothetical protein